ncbi:MAG TPA: prenyltransferase/squalene oxidase repeat-containing protein [Acidimicrobiales bacterium]|jgi:hypothetical protein
MRHRLVLGALVGALALPSIVAVAPAGAADPASERVAGRAVRWLDTVQQPDGSFELAGFPGFETPAAVLAIAEWGQADGTWSTDEARAAVRRVREDGHNSLEALDDLADGEFGALSAGQAAKLIVLDVVPLGLDPTAFDPERDGATDLVAVVLAGRRPDGSFGAFNATLYAALAYSVLGRPVPSSTRQLIVSSQQANGGWDFAGDPSGAEVDVDTTGLALQALVAAGMGPGTTPVRRGLAFLARTQNADGSWPSLFEPKDPNATAVAVLAVTAAGGDVNGPCWRDQVAPELAGQPYGDPDAWLRSQQAADGHIASPNDEFGVNTFATSQTVQALLRSWLPVERAGLQPCPAA